MRDHATSIDQAIREAQAEGKFDDLEGKGKPLHLDPSPDAVIRNLLKEADVKPAWIELEGQIDRALSEADTLIERFAAEAASTEARLLAGPAPSRAQPAPHPSWRARLIAHLSFAPAPTAAPVDDLTAYHRRWESRLVRYANLLHQANRQIRRFNLIVPIVARQRLPIRVGERLEQFAERFPCYERNGEGALHPVRGVVPVSPLTPPPEPGADPQARRDLQRAAALEGVRRFGRRTPPIG